MNEGKKERKRGNLRLWDEDDVIDVSISLFPFHLTGYINPHATLVIITHPFICSSMNKSSHRSANPLAMVLKDHTQKKSSLSRALAKKRISDYNVWMWKTRVREEREISKYHKLCTRARRVSWSERIICSV